MLALVLVARSVTAQEPSQPLQELFFTEVVYPQEKHQMQVMLGALVDRSRPDLAALVPFSIEYGLTDNWQIEAGWDAYTEFNRSTVTQLRTARFSLGTKYSFMNIRGWPVHAAMGIELDFPRTESFAETEGEEGAEIEPFLAMAVDVGRRVSVFGSIGASAHFREVSEFVRSGVRHDDPGVASVGALVAFRHVTVAGEYTNRSDELPWRLGGGALVTPSVVFHAAPEWEFAIGAPIGVRAGQHRAGVAMRVLKEF